MFDTPTPAHTRTTPVVDPYRVRLAGISADEAVVWVHDEVIAEGYRIVRNAHTEGFWYLTDSFRVPGEVPVALFKPDRTTSFSCPLR